MNAEVENELRHPALISVFRWVATAEKVCSVRITMGALRHSVRWPLICVRRFVRPNTWGEVNEDMTNVYKARNGRIFETKEQCARYESAMDVLELCCTIEREINPFSRRVISEERHYSADNVVRNWHHIKAIMNAAQEEQI